MEARDEIGGTAVQDAQERRLDQHRPCTRCDGEQHLVAGEQGMGKYRCDTCELVIGFDLSAAEPEFLISRGLPSRYTMDRFSSIILGSERRL